MENGIKSFENAEKAVDVAIKGLGRTQIFLLQCKLLLSAPKLSNY